MAEAEQHERVGIVMDGPSGQRFAERLTRSGVVAHAVSFEVFEQQASAGQIYLASLSLSASAEAAARRGAHICLMPPWPVGPVTFDVGSVGAAEAERRGVVRYTSALDASGALHGAFRSLKILYRERLVGTLGTALAESETGEPLLATLPRASNRHGYIIVTTLQLGIASAQTRFDDMAHLIDSLYTWCISHAEPVTHTIQEVQNNADESSQAEASAHIVLLALSLAASDPTSMMPLRDTPQRQTVIGIERARNDFNQVCHILGMAAEPALFDSGWGWLEAHGVLSVVESEVAALDMDASERYSGMWQLGPRLRRLHRISGVTW